MTILEDLQSEEYEKKRLLRDAALLDLPEEKLRALKEILARTKNIDDAVQEFRRLKKEPETKTMHDGNGRYFVARSEEEMIQRLHAGAWFKA